SRSYGRRIGGRRGRHGSRGEAGVGRDHGGGGKVRRRIAEGIGIAGWSRDVVTESVALVGRHVWWRGDRGGVVFSDSDDKSLFVKGAFWIGCSHRHIKHCRRSFKRSADQSRGRMNLQ